MDATKPQGDVTPDKPEPSPSSETPPEQVPAKDSPPSVDKTKEVTPEEKLLESKEDLQRRLRSLANRMKSNHTGWLAHFGYSYAERRFRPVLDQCNEMHKELTVLPDDEASIIDFRARIWDLEASYNRLRFRLVLLPSAVVLFSAIIGILAVADHSGVVQFIQNKLEIKRLMRYVLLAIAGAILYLLTSVMARHAARTRESGGETSLLTVIIRILIAIVVPTIIVMITFKKGGTPIKVADLWKSPELWSFLCGYSSNIVVMALNKMVEKVSKMIESV